MGWWNEIFRRRAEDWVYSPLDPEQVPDNASHEQVATDSAYLSVFLRSMRVVHVRRGLSRFYGTVHSFTSLPHRSGDQARFNVVTTPGDLKDVDAAHLDRVIQMNQRLLGPVPYRGGDLEMEVGLFSIRSAELAAPFLAVLEKMSSIAGVSYVSAALPFAEPILDGVNLLTGGSDSSVLEIGLATTFTNVETGYFLVMGAPKGQVDVNNLRVDPEDYRLVDQDGKPVGDYPYMVLQVVASPTRDDWFSVPGLAEPYGVLQKDIRDGEVERAKQSLIVFKRAVLTCDDLLTEDAKNLIAKVENEVNSVMDALAVTRGAPRDRGKPRSIQNLEEIRLYS